jgi:hypothetical protein
MINCSFREALMDASMQGWEAALLATLAGAIGGVVNALLSNNGFILPRSVPSTGGGTIWMPGVIGNVIVGAVAAVLSWGLYGSGAGVPMLSAVKVDLTWAGFAAATLVGVGGSRWLSAEVDKQLLRDAAIGAANKVQSPNLSAAIASLSPAAMNALVRAAP